MNYQHYNIAVFSRRLSAACYMVSAWVILTQQYLITKNAILLTLGTVGSKWPTYSPFFAGFLSFRLFNTENEMNFFFMLSHHGGIWLKSWLGSKWPNAEPNRVKMTFLTHILWAEFLSRQAVCTCSVQDKSPSSQRS